MEKSKHDLVIESLNGRIIDDYIEGWTFQVREVSSNFFRVDGKDANGRTALGAGVDPDKAFDDCVKGAKRIIFIQKNLSQIKNLVNKLLGFGN